MSKWKSGTLQSGSGQPVKNRKQAIAIMLSEKAKAAGNPEYRASFKDGGTSSGEDMFHGDMVGMDLRDNKNRRYVFDDGGVSPEDDSQSQDGVAARAMHYGSQFGENNRDANYGPAGNELQPYDVAISPALAQHLGLGLGDWIEAYGRPYRVADWSYVHPGQPTHNAVEFRDHPADGHVNIRPIAPPQDMAQVAALPRMSAPSEGMAPDIPDPFSSEVQSSIAQAPKIAGDITGDALSFANQDLTSNDLSGEDTESDALSNLQAQSARAGTTQIDWSGVHPVAKSPDGKMVKMSNGLWIDRETGAIHYNLGAQQYAIPPGGNKPTQIKPRIVKDQMGIQYQEVGNNVWQPLNLPGQMVNTDLSKIKPGDWSTVPADIRDMAYQIATYRSPRLSSFALRSPYFQQLLQVISKVDPSFDYKQYEARQALLKDLTSSGKFGSNVVSFNAAIDHAAQLLDANSVNKQGSSQLWNSIKALGYKAGLSPSGHDPFTAGESVSGILAPEAVRAIKGSAPDVHEVQSWEGRLSPQAGWDRNKTAVSEIVQAIDKRLGEINARYKNAFGSDAKLLSDQALAQLKSIAAHTDDPEVKKIIKKYENNSNPYVVEQADQLGIPSPAASPTP